MARENRDTLITKTISDKGTAVRRPTQDLLNLIKLTNEIADKSLPSSYRIYGQLETAGRINTLSDFVAFDIHNIEDEWPGGDPRPALPEKKRIAREQIIEHIIQLTTGCERLHDAIFSDNPVINIRNGDFETIDEQIIYRYDELVFFAQNLTQIAAITSFNLKSLGVEGYKRVSMKQHYLSLPPSSPYHIKNGKFHFGFDIVAQHLQNVEAVRLRCCSFCHKVFWAFDLRMLQCSRQCSNKKSQKKWYSDPEHREGFLRNKKAEYHLKRPGKDRFPSRVRQEEEE